jgi:bifunctional NMN adenylyltransferase/nudix hydrolase
MYASGALTNSVFDYMFGTFPQRNKDEYERLCREHEHIKNYKKQWSVAPYPPTFVTTDAVVIQSGHVLLVRRKSAPGEGLWALPGGFLEQDESIDAGLLRELRQETGLKVPEPVLLGSVKARRVFDHPGRSLRGRTITHAALIELSHGKLPKVKGLDDADKACWFTLAQFEHMEEQMFEDHFHIVNYFLGRI